MEKKEAYRPTLIDSFLLVFFLFFLGWAFEFSGVYVPMEHRYSGGFWAGALLTFTIGVLVFTLLKWRKEALLLITDPRFCVASGTALAVATILGTIILQMKTPEQYDAIYGANWSRLFQNLFLTRIFWSVWYSALFLGFLVGLFLVPLRKKAFRLEKLGFLLAHWGFGLIVLGSFVGYFWGYSGRVQLFPGDTKHIIRLDHHNHPKALPFQIHLKKFWIDYYPPETKLDLFLVRSRPGRPMDVHQIRTWTLQEIQEQGKVALKPSPYKVEVVQYYPHFGLKKEMLPQKEQTKESYLSLQMKWKYKGKKGEYTFFPAVPQRAFYVFPRRELLLFFFEEDLPRGAEKQFRSGKIDARHEITLFWKGERHTLDVEVKKSYQIKGLKLTVEKFYPKAKWDQESQTMKNERRGEPNPALQVTLEHKGKKATFWLFHRHPQLKAEQIEGAPALEYQYIRAHHGFQNYLIGSVKSRKLLHIRDGKIVNSWKLGESLSLKDIDFTLEEAKLQWVKLKFNPTNLSEEPKNPAVQIRIWQGNELILERFLFAKPQEWSQEKVQSAVRTPDGKYIVRFRFHRPIFHYVSDVEIYEEGKPMASGEIRVNEPLWYRFHALYQTDHIGEEGTVLTVAYDPGLPFVLLGIFLTILGIPYMFYLTPYLRMRKKEKLALQLSLSKDKE